MKKANIMPSIQKVLILVIMEVHKNDEMTNQDKYFLVLILVLMEVYL